MLTARKRFLALASVIAFGSVFSLSAQTAPARISSVPTPESVLGHKPGDDFYLANYDESREYFHKLAASSDRIKLITVGKTTRGLGLGDCSNFVARKISRSLINTRALIIN